MVRVGHTQDDVNFNYLLILNLLPRCDTVRVDLCSLTASFDGLMKAYSTVVERNSSNMTYTQR